MQDLFTTALFQQLRSRLITGLIIGPACYVGLGLSFTPIAQAGIITIPDAGSPQASNTLTQLGFGMKPILDSQSPDGTAIASLQTADGMQVNLSPVTVKRTVPNGGWSTWGHGYTGPVYSDYTTTTLTLTFTQPVTAFDFYAEPDPFSVNTIRATAMSGLITTWLSQDINGKAGAKYFGFYSNDVNDLIASITLTSAQNFAIGEMRLASNHCPPAAQAVPIPALIPGLLGFGLSVWRRHKARDLAKHSET